MKSLSLWSRQRMTGAVLGLLASSVFTACSSQTHQTDSHKSPVSGAGSSPLPASSAAAVGAPAPALNPASAPVPGGIPASNGAAAPATGVLNQTMAVLAEGQAGQMMLPIGKIYGQGLTNYCWAYAAFNTLRTYYYDTDATDAATLSWRKALQAIDSEDGLKNYLNTNGNGGGFFGGTPEDFISGLQKAYNLPAQNWQTLDSSNATASIHQVASNIRKKIPTVICDSDHCRMVYGFVTDGTKITKFAIADSAGDPDTYLEAVTEGNGRFAGLVSLVQ